jgi:hypothetical protein
MENFQFTDVLVDENLISYCGLYCGACRSFIKGKCPGCKENNKATWCKIRKCNIEHSYLSCADCSLTELEDCRKFNNFISKIFSLLFKSDRGACIKRIKEIGYYEFAAEMAKNKTQSIKWK